MAEELEEQIWQALKKVHFPGMKRDVVSFGFVRGVTVDGGVARVVMEVATHNPEAAKKIRGAVEAEVGQLPGVTAVDLQLRVNAPPTPQQRTQQATARDPKLIPEVRHVVAVASGKGGVGKSTVAANLAVSLARLGHSTGLLDADIYGPSVPTMFGIEDKPRVIDNRLQTLERHGIQVMSLGFLVDTDTPVIWRGPMVMRALEQMLGDVDWGPLDYLVVDMPPGTGDAQLTLSQKVPLSGAVVVTTPQDVALIDARKGFHMFRKVNVPVVGIVENMSTFVCPHCGEATEVFSSGGGERTAQELGTRLLGKIPLDAAIVLGGDEGEPIVVSQPEGPHAKAFREIAEAVVDEVAAGESERPSLSIV
ncbi:MAG: Mrp/NBP35 family ATP-binding protein [Acidobacteriota bacterium]|nr:Mrp/NBP35 family ATP-binding protein [Acidobacteriota bacterium]